MLPTADIAIVPHCWCSERPLWGMYSMWLYVARNFELISSLPLRSQTSMHTPNLHPLRGHWQQVWEDELAAETPTKLGLFLQGLVDSVLPLFVPLLQDLTNTTNEYPLFDWGTRPFGLLDIVNYLIARVTCWVSGPPTGAQKWLSKIFKVERQDGKTRVMGYMNHAHCPWHCCKVTFQLRSDGWVWAFCAVQTWVAESPVQPNKKITYFSWFNRRPQNHPDCVCYSSRPHHSCKQLVFDSLPYLIPDWHQLVHGGRSKARTC